MNQSHDIASELSETARRVPFPPAQRRFAFVASDALSHCQAIQAAWDRWVGLDTEYVFPNASKHRLHECGIVLVFRGSCDFPASVLALFKLGRDVFEYCPLRGNFLRLDEETFQLFYCK